MSKKPAGRPPKEGEKKTSFHLCLYPSQIEEYLRQASEKHLSRSEYLIYKLNLNKKP